MNREDIISMALKANLIYDETITSPWVEGTNLTLYLERFAALVAYAEREACAKVCDGWTHADGDRCAEAIRARGDKHD